MPPRLPAELDSAIKTQGIPLRVVGVDGQGEYIILTGEQYDRIRVLVERGDMTDEEQRSLLRHAGERAGWNDAEMDAYDQYDANRKTKP
jgi:hypothetical protein